VPQWNLRFLRTTLSARLMELSAEISGLNLRVETQLRYLRVEPMMPARER
jgi:hypothetical protein